MYHKSIEHFIHLESKSKREFRVKGSWKSTENQVVISKVTFTSDYSFTLF